MTVQPIGEVVRLAVSGARKIGASQASQTDRTLAALTLVGIAVAIAWSRDRKIPAVANKAGELGRQVWQRRSWWVS